MPTSHSAHVIASLDVLPSLTDARGPRHREGQRQYAVLQDSGVRLLDDRLETINLRAIDARAFNPPKDLSLLAADGLDRLVLTTGPDLLLLIGKTPVTIPGLAGDAAAFTGDHLLVTAPANDRHRILLIEPVTGMILDEAAIDADEATAFITPHPVESVPLIEFAMGQDGCLAVRAEIEETKLRVTSALTEGDPVIAGFSPSGKRLLVLPHPNDPDTARVLAWPSLARIGQLTAKDLNTRFGISLAACWVDEDRIALYAMEDSLVITDGELQDPKRVKLPLDFGDNADLELLTPLAPGRIAAGIWTPEKRSTLIIEIT